MKENIVSRIKNNADIYSKNIALEVDEHSLTYSELWNKSSRIAEVLKANLFNKDFIGILAYRSLTAYTGILGTLISGNTYLPFNLKFPKDRILRMIDRSGARVFIIGEEFLNMLKEIESELSSDLLFIAPELSREQIPSLKFKVITKEETVIIPTDHQTADIEPDDKAYLMFTSGTTGEPKGISISHKNLISFIDTNQSLYPLTPGDRCSQAFPTTFDCSVQDIFATWNAGACLVCIPEKELIAPVKFINNKKLSVWYSVPSAAMLMKRMNLLKENIFPTLRYSLFCGEALNEAVANAWQKAAPDSTIVNLYGPTEATIAIAYFTWQNQVQTINGIIPIGRIFPTHEHLIVNEELLPVSQNDIGELLVSGPQVFTGYLNDPDNTAKKLICLEYKEGTYWYKTGDLVKEDENGILHYMGRIDHQVKIRGFRVELEEIEKLVREASGKDFAVALPYPFQSPVAESIVVTLEEGNYDKANIIDLCRLNLPDYMIPKDIIPIKSFPLNNNGKIDRNKITTMLKESYGY